MWKWGVLWIEQAPEERRERRDVYKGRKIDVCMCVKEIRVVDQREGEWF